MPRSDVEMIFPNTKVRFRLFDKIKFGVTAGGGVGMGVFGTVGKIAIASNPYTLAGGAGRPRRRGAAPGLQLHQPAQPLHGGAGAEPLFPRHGRQPGRDDAARRPRRRGGHQGGDAALQRAGQGARSTSATSRQVDEAIEHYLADTFGIDVDFDVDDALQRLKQDGIVTELPTARCEPCRRARPPCTSTSSGTPASTTCPTWSSRKGREIERRA